MRSASIKEIRDTISDIDRSQLEEICLKLARFKKENKELITYLLYEADDETSYINHVCEDLALAFKEVNKSNLYFAKKNIRKIIRNANKYIRYSGHDVTEVELLLFTGLQIKALNLDLSKSQALLNLFNGLIKKAEKKIKTLHEDLQYDFLRELEKLKK